MDRDSSPGAAHRGMTALHLAAKSGPLSLVAMLLGCSANPCQGTEDGTLPLDLVSRLFTRGGSEVRTLLRERMGPHILVEGWLTKLGTERKVFRRRYCLLLPEQVIAWQSHGNHTAITWQSHGNHMAITWQSHGNHMAITWQSHVIALPPPGAASLVRGRRAV